MEKRRKLGRNQCGCILVGVVSLWGLALGFRLLQVREHSFEETTCLVKHVDVFEVGCDGPKEEGEPACFRPVWTVFLSGDACTTVRVSEVYGLLYETKEDADSALGGYPENVEGHPCWAQLGTCMGGDVLWTFEERSGTADALASASFFVAALASTGGQCAWRLRPSNAQGLVSCANFLPWIFAALVLATMLACGVSYYGFKGFHENYQDGVGAYEGLRFISDSGSATSANTYVFCFGLTAASFLQLVAAVLLRKVQTTCRDWRGSSGICLRWLPDVAFASAAMTSAGLWMVGTFPSNTATHRHYVGLYIFVLGSVVNMFSTWTMNAWMARECTAAERPEAKLLWESPRKQVSLAMGIASVVCGGLFLTLPERSTAASVAEYLMVLALLAAFVTLTDPLMQYRFETSAAPILKGQSAVDVGSVQKSAAPVDRE